MIDILFFQDLEKNVFFPSDYAGPLGYLPTLRQLSVLLYIHVGWESNPRTQSRIHYKQTDVIKYITYFKSSIEKNGILLEMYVRNKKSIPQININYIFALMQFMIIQSADMDPKRLMGFPYFCLTIQHCDVKK